MSPTQVVDHSAESKQTSMHLLAIEQQIDSSLYCKNFKTAKGFRFSSQSWH